MFMVPHSVSRWLPITKVDNENAHEIRSKNTFNYRLHFLLNGSLALWSDEVVCHFFHNYITKKVKQESMAIIGL
jgi:hypothetical protein